MLDDEIQELENEAQSFTKYTLDQPPYQPTSPRLMPDMIIDGRSLSDGNFVPVPDSDSDETSDDEFTISTFIFDALSLAQIHHCIGHATVPS
jgi:hypothetical protein